MEWLDAPIDLQRLLARLRVYGEANGVSAKTLDGLTAILQSPTVAELVKLPSSEWSDVLVNDLYKVTMHQMYARFLSGVSAEFCLHVRKAPMTLCELATRHPQLFSELQAQVAKLRDVQPYSQAVLTALETHYPGFTMSKDMAVRAETFGVAPVSWSSECLVCTGGSSTVTALDLAPATAEEPIGQHGQPTNTGHQDAARSALAEQAAQECDIAMLHKGWNNRQYKDCTCIAAGPIESTSHCETTVMQLVQAAMIRAQVEELQGHTSAQGQGPPDVPSSNATWPDRTELLASSLAHLGRVIDRLNSRDHGLKISLFAGRRSSDRFFLVLQNMAFAQLVKGYQGTSSVYAAAVLAKVWDTLDWPLDQRYQYLGPLHGTHAHEQSSILQQLLADMDMQAGTEPLQGQGSAPRPLPVSSLLAHLLFLVANGRMDTATALPDTFGTPSFLAVALAADVPEAMREDMLRGHGVELRSDSKCFDFIRVWRVDSGSYEEMAELIVSAWERRCQQLAGVTTGSPTTTSTSIPVAEGGSSGNGAGPPDNPGTHLPRPILMHSNLSTVEEVLQVSQLPERIRPDIVAFGTLADGFFPLQAPSVVSDGAVPPTAGSGGAPIKMTSLVMKVVQARAPKVTVTQPSALKVGDTSSRSVEGKMERDPRLSDEECGQLLALVNAMRQTVGELDEQVVSRVLAQAYTMVARDGVLRM